MGTFDIVEDKKPIKIGGLLILVAIGIVLSPFNTIYFLWITYPPIFSDGIWEVLTTQGSESYSPLWAPFLISEIIINIIFVLLGGYLVYLFFKKRKEFPKWYLGLSLFSSVFIVVDAYVATLILPDIEVFDSETTKEFVRSLVSLLIWSPYLFMSQRAKDTFVNIRT